MREIKFRAWHKLNKEFYGYDLLLRLDGNLVCEVDRGENVGLFDRTFNDDFILMQFTGLHDKNGVKIYEGDVLQHLSHIEPVTYFSDECRFDTYSFGCDSWMDSEVIGNIYQNRELLAEPIILDINDPEWGELI